jgi:hypothetical protein
MEASTPAPRRVLPIVIVVLAVVIGFVSVLALWVKRQALETDTWTETSTELLENETIRNAVADFAVNALYDNVDVQAQIASALPPRLQPLAGPAAGGLRQATTEVSQRLLAQPKVQALWEDANRTAHEKLLALLDDEAEFASTAGGVVTLDLAAIIGQIADTVGLPSSLVDKLPPDAAQVEILRSDQLSAAQTGVKALRTAAWVLTAITLALFALAIYLARGRHREVLRAVGFGFVILGALVLFARNRAGDALTASLTGTAASEPPVDATWQISTSLLVETAESLIIYGVVIILAAWLAGQTSVAVGARRWLTPYLRQPRIAYGGLAALLLLLFWWDPVVATHRVVPSILLIVFAAIGIEALRRQVTREFPDLVTTHSAQGAAQAMRDRMHEARQRRIARSEPGGGPAAPAADPRLDALERLAELHGAGVLSDAELAAEKERVLASASPPPS